MSSKTTKSQEIKKMASFVREKETSHASNLTVSLDITRKQA